MVFSPLEVNWRFVGKYYLNLQGGKHAKQETSISNYVRTSAPI
jgi:hypothetical protein